MKIIIPISWKTKSLTNKQRIPTNVQIKSVKISKIIISNKSQEVNRQNKKYKPSIVPVSFYCFLISEWPPPSPPDVILLKERKREKKGKRKKTSCHNKTQKKKIWLYSPKEKCQTRRLTPILKKKRKKIGKLFICLYIFSTDSHILFFLFLSL